MKLTGKAREQAKVIIKHIESLGGKLQKECPGGSIYCSLNAIRQVRISDHIALKGDIDRIDIIIQQEKNTFKYVCIYYRNMVIYDNIGKVKQWIENLEFVINVVLMNMATSSIVNKRNYEKQIDTLKKEITLKENKAIEYKKEIEELKQIRKEKLKLQTENTNIKNHEKKLRKKIDNLTQYHNMWQTVSSENRKLQKQLKELYIYKSHFNDGEA
jgi:DNA repair exonuclease SbcCD ATPase subunit